MQTFPQGFYNTFSILFLVTFLYTCSPQPKNNQNELLALLAAAEISNNSKTNCPPKILPQGIPIANTVVSANSSVSGFNDSSKAINGICGGGELSGSLDVYALNLTGTGATLILSWGGKIVKNVTGIDFIIYENPFRVTESSDRYAFDPMVVQVSYDGTNYCGFDLSGFNSSTADSNKISSWPGFAGLRPVLYNMSSNLLSLEQLFTSTGSGFLLGGGDGFNIDDLITNASCDNTALNQIKSLGFKYIKMTSASAVTNPNTSSGYVYPHSYSNGSDIDGVVAKSVE
ncbi:LIC_13355 family lipoprotein [Leptospira sp. 85282-16]|uniref:LIC_13355 family lipoprotein n=1 Tax=Leptospira montravelensis TaxID=2484961 RepID=A0ABY2LS14_9LEPT|nr:MULTISPECIES: LIC_13355 family lipoprotein [Leptospira]MCT8334771.1 LIC_13355 family lipoprotein [Leptospira sp. 85282-16]TGK81097.1 LIC_13355 family lipoprotein [Leptospira montravelensis]TGL01305.1 LIC_13355 family lipoprotein [Leptospira montravelensis]